MFDDITKIDIPMDMQLDVYSEVSPLTATMIASLEANKDFLNGISDEDLDNIMKDFDNE